MKGIETCAIEERTAELTGRMNEMKDELRERADAAQQEMRRNFRKVKAKADDLLDEGRHEIKSHPLTAVATFAGAGLLLGFVAGLVVGSRKRA